MGSYAQDFVGEVMIIILISCWLAGRKLVSSGWGSRVWTLIFKKGRVKIFRLVFPVLSRK